MTRRSRPSCSASAVACSPSSAAANWRRAWTGPTGPTGRRLIGLRPGGERRHSRPGQREAGRPARLSIRPQPAPATGRAESPSRGWGFAMAMRAVGVPTGLGAWVVHVEVTKRLAALPTWDERADDRSRSSCPERMKAAVPAPIGAPRPPARTLPLSEQVGVEPRRLLRGLPRAEGREGARRSSASVRSSSVDLALRRRCMPRRTRGQARLGPFRAALHRDARRS